MDRWRSRASGSVAVFAICAADDHRLCGHSSLGHRHLCRDCRARIVNQCDFAGWACLCRRHGCRRLNRQSGEYFPLATTRHECGKRRLSWCAPGLGTHSGVGADNGDRLCSRVDAAASRWPAVSRYWHRHFSGGADFRCCFGDSHPGSCIAVAARQCRSLWRAAADPWTRSSGAWLCRANPALRDLCRAPPCCGACCCWCCSGGCWRIFLPLHAAA